MSLYDRIALPSIYLAEQAARKSLEDSFKKDFIVLSPEEKRQVLIGAVYADNVKMLTVLFDCDPDIDINYGNTIGRFDLSRHLYCDRGNLLISAAYEGRIKIVKLLLRKGVDVNKESEWKTTAIMFAAQAKHYDIVKLLLENGANIETSYRDIFNYNLSDNKIRDIVKEYLTRGQTNQLLLQEFRKQYVNIPCPPKAPVVKQKKTSKTSFNLLDMISNNKLKHIVPEEKPKICADTTVLNIEKLYKQLDTLNDQERDKLLEALSALSKLMYNQ